MELSIMNVIIVMLVCAMSAFLSHMGMAVFHDGIRPVIDHHAEVPEMPIHIADHRIKHQHFAQRVDKLISHLFIIRPDSPHAALRNEMADREVGIRFVGKKLAGGAENAFPTG